MTLDQLLADAAARGLTQFSLNRMHSREAMWQASSRWTWSDGFRIAIQPSPEAAAAEALSAQPVSDQRGRAPELPAVVSVFD
ncbi:hypothetical protein ASF22_02545 [Methylobacterium sp. Leaf87]|uniref:hypothetical protein n=1 Tax=Methylobacterium sp. Leaf87 TaxID=1736243 RepID=UPI0006F78D94|nr:hypothetical protein [Methylobacterium sp. Leaf87]KQO69507.1 hypothetical protein ASF22_02545 [Methylobacterium sp. Leaf87]